MKRNLENLEEYKQTCVKVWDRANGFCEVLLKGIRCAKYIPFEEARYINYLHKDTRNGKSDAWVLNPNNIVFGCAEHHIEEERTGIRVESVDYWSDEPIYIPE